MNERAIRLATVFSFVAAFILAGAFFLAASLQGYGPLPRYAGAVWVFILALVVALPTIAPILKKRLRGKSN
jgi:NADH:ubiquinone oxidoreductase subunit 6 (subunit J)